MKNKVTKDFTKLAGKNYDVLDYNKNDQLSSGLAQTHEQVSDAYMEGEIKPVIEKKDK